MPFIIDFRFLILLGVSGWRRVGSGISGSTVTALGFNRSYQAVTLVLVRNVLMATIGQHDVIRTCHHFAIGVLLVTKVVVAVIFHLVIETVGLRRLYNIESPNTRIVNEILL